MGPGTEDIPVSEVAPADLVPGMVVINYCRPDVRILRAPETDRDRFGRDRLKVWAVRTDTGEEGYLLYGFGAKVPVRL